jgi:hypothetical protein
MTTLDLLSKAEHIALAMAEHVKDPNADFERFIADLQGIHKQMRKELERPKATLGQLRGGGTP